MNEFDLAPDLIHLNHAAVAPWPRRTVAAVTAFAEQNRLHGSRYYSDWLAREAMLRERLRQLIGAADCDEIALVKNTSEALSIVAFGIDWRAGDEVVISNQEFPSNRIVWEALADRGVVVRYAELQQTASTPEAALAAQITDRTRLLAISSVQYGSGLRLDLATLGAICQQHGILFCVDAIQSVGAMPMDVQQCQIDFLMADGHKWMLGPEGLGLFYCRRERLDQLQLQQYGWHMVADMGNYDRSDWQIAPSARRFECGSPNMLAIHALEASLSLLQEVGMEQVTGELLRRSDWLIEQLPRYGMEVLTPTTAQRHAGIVTFRPERGDPHPLQQQLMAHGVLCAARGGGIRFSPHFYTPFSSMEKALVLLAQLHEHASPA